MQIQEKHLNQVLHVEKDGVKTSANSNKICNYI